MSARTLSPAYPIETARLLLRPIDPATDVDAMHAYQSLPEVCRYVPYSPQTRDQVAARLADPAKVRATLLVPGPGQAIFLAVVVRESRELVGDVMLAWKDETNAEIGYVINPRHHGQGIATEAAAALLRLAFDPQHGLGIHRVIARIDQRNPASAAVLRKVGMRQEAVLVENEWFKGEWSTEVDFAILDREWQAGSGRK
jgi:RimJ/RimL family protein N-acetyltransferase